MGRISYEPALGVIRQGLKAFWPVAALAFATVLLPGTVSYARGSNGSDEATTPVRVEQPGLADRAAVAVTAAMVGSRHAEQLHLHVGSAGFFYTAE